jgi:molecular chaperone GrpE
MLTKNDDEDAKHCPDEPGQPAPSGEREAEAPAFQVIDRRIFSNPDAVDLDKVEVPGPRYPSVVEELRARAAEAERRFAEKRQEMQEEIARVRTRLQADFERKLEQEKHSILLPFLEVLDNLDRALAAVPDASMRGGLEVTVRDFRARLQAKGVEEIQVVGLPYDPNTGEAVGLVPVDSPSRDGVVVEEVQRGYRLGERLLRPARVRVGALSTQ